MTVDYRDSHLAIGKGRSYHRVFSEDPYRSMVWRLEQRILDRVVAQFYSHSEIDHLDFACGTGRILSHLADHVNTAVGVDVSPTMLEVASGCNRNAEIIEADLTRKDVLGGRMFNLITAFRFFPNAQCDLRLEAMQVLRKHLGRDGYLVFNNHRNSGSTRQRLARLLGRGGYGGMSVAETGCLLRECRLELVKTYHLCVFPASERRRLLPVFVLRSLETVLSGCRPLRNLAENLIYVCRRAESEE